MVMRSVGGKSFRIVKESPGETYGIYYESLNPGIRTFHTGLNSLDEAITYVLIEIEKECKKKRIQEKKHEEFIIGSEQSSIRISGEAE